MKNLRAAKRLKGAAITRLRRAIERRGKDRGWESSLTLQTLERAGDIPGLGAMCLRWAGFMHAADGRHERAIADYEAACARGLAGDASLHYDLGLSLLGAGQTDRARSEFQAAATLADDESWPASGFAELGRSLLRDGQPECAETAFRDAARLASGEIWPIYGLVDALRAQGRRNEVVPELLAAAEVTPPGRVRNLPFPTYGEGFVARSEVQVEALRELVRRHPDAERAAILLARVETLRANVPFAVELFRRAGETRWGKTPASSAAAAKPSFLVIGQAKAGTSALFEYLSAHPSIEPPLVKELRYWSVHHDCGPDWHAAQFPPLRPGDGRMTGEASPDYFVDPSTPARVAAGLPGVKLILSLRDPVARAWSEYWMYVQRREESASFENVVADEMNALPTCPLDHAEIDDLRPGYLLRSAALPHLKRWLAHVDPQDLLILQSRDLARDLPSTINRVYRFLGVPPFVPPDQRRHNEGSYPPMPPDLERRLRAWFEPHDRALQAFLATLPEARP